MSQRTLYKCDKCGTESEDSKIFKQIKFELHPYSAYSYSSYEFRGGQLLHLCSKCLSKIGIIKKEAPTKNVTPAPADVIYDMIAEIVHECLNNQ